MKTELIITTAVLMAICSPAFANDAYDRLVPIPPSETTKMLVAAKRGWSGTKQNSVSHHTCPMVTFKDKQYLAFYDESHKVAIASRNIASTDWVVTTTPFKATNADSHFALAMGVGPDGSLHLAWSNHHTPMNYAVSVRPQDETEWMKAEMIPGQDDRAEYVQFIMDDRTKHLLCLYYRGKNNSGGNVLNRYDPETRSWTRVGRVPIIEWCSSSAHVGPFGNLTLFAENGRGSGRLGIIRSFDLGQSWGADSGAGRLPEGACNQGFGIMNQPGMAYDRKGNFYVAYYRYDEHTDHVVQIYLRREDGDTWHEHQVTRRTVKHQESYSAGIYRPLTRSWMVVDDDGRAIILFVDKKERGNVISAAVSKPGDYDSWRYYVVDDTKVFSSEPWFDVSMWRQHRRLCIYVQASGGDGQGKRPDGPQDVHVVEWRLQGQAQETIVPEEPAPGSNIARTARSLGSYKNGQRHAYAIDGDVSTFWNARGRSGWIALDFRAPRTFDRIILREQFPRAKTFELQRWTGRDWETFHTGTKIGGKRLVTFEPVTAQKIRLVAGTAKNSFALAEWEVYHGEPQELP